MFVLREGRACKGVKSGVVDPFFGDWSRVNCFPGETALRCFNWACFFAVLREVLTGWGSRFWEGTLCVLRPPPVTKSYQTDIGR